MASYYDYYDYGPACYDPPEPNYYDSEPSYDPEPEYYDPEPSYDDDAFYDNQDHADAPTEEIYEDYGHGSDADIPAYHEGGYYAEEDGDVGVMSVDCDGLRYEADYPVLGDEEYMLEDEQSPVEDEFAYTAHAEAPCTFADILADTVSWADKLLRGPPSEPAPPHVPWMADHLDAMQYALQQGHVPENERAKPRAGFGTRSARITGTRTMVTAAPAPTEFAEYPVDLPVAYDVEANFLEDAFHQAFNILSMRAIPSPPRRARPPSTTRKHPIHMLVPPPTSTRRSVRSQPHVVQRSNSAQSKGKTRHVHPRRTRSCPDFTREALPHLPRPPDVSTPSVATVPAGDPVPQRKVVPPNIAGTAVAVSPPPRSAVRARSYSPPTVVSPMSPPIPPNIPLAVTTPAASPSTERRRNALRRIAKKGKG
ncbi:hypothetical protein B0H10DRAFT_2211386 [Mycena sp. CBHHK59/15]|nr:hypothetical protein B0H10DRAFT_2211386 [Mycena sp. CBHHK59/15]